MFEKKAIRNIEGYIIFLTVILLNLDLEKDCILVLAFYFRILISPDSHCL